jgi:putative heme transporter
VHTAQPDKLDELTETAGSDPRPVGAVAAGDSTRLAAADQGSRDGAHSGDQNSAQMSPVLPAPESERGKPSKPSRLKNLWKRFRVVFTLSVLGLAGWFVASRRSEWSNAGHLFTHADLKWIGIAVLAEIASMVVFARMQRWLLRAGGVRVPIRTMVEITVAGNAVSATLPGGVAWSAAWVFGQLGRRGVDRFLRVWVFLVAGAFSSFALFLVVFVGIELAGKTGPVSDLRWAVFGLACIPVAALVVMAIASTHIGARDVHKLVADIEEVPPGRFVVKQLRSLGKKLDAVHLSKIGWAEVLGLALLNWIYDCVVLIASMLALGIPVPWRGIFVIYGLTQIAAVLPVTPGGVGVVEGALGGLLHAYGVATQAAIATVLLYRLVSFWGLVPIGWGLWGLLNATERHGSRAVRPHPWAFHQHGPDAVETTGGPTPKPREGTITRLTQPRPCTGCNEQG